MWSPTYSSDELYHHGILGMKWGVRRYQNPDGTLTAAGRRHLNMGEKKRSPGLVKKAANSVLKNQLKANVELAEHNLNLYDKQSAKRGGGDPSKRKYYELDVEREKARYDSYDKTHPSLTDEDKAKMKNAAKMALKIGATVAVAYAGYKVATDPKIRRMAERGIDRLKGVNTNQSIEQLLANSGPKIVKFKSNKDKIAGLKLHKINRIGKDKETIKRAENKLRKLEELEKNAGQHGVQAKSGANVANTATNRATDLEKLLANNRKLQMMANQSYSTATKSTESLDYAKELLKKNKGKLSGYTMKDLYDLNF